MTRIMLDQAGPVALAGGGSATLTLGPNHLGMEWKVERLVLTANGEVQAYQDFAGPNALGAWEVGLATPVEFQLDLPYPRTLILVATSQSSGTFTAQAWGERTHG